MTARPLTVAVTGLNATDNPGPGVPVIRAIRAAAPDTRIIGLAYDALDPGCYMDGIADHTFLLPYPSQGADTLLGRLMEIHEATPIDVLIPTLDSELAAMLRIRGRLFEAGIHTFLPDQQALDRRDKSRLHELNDDGIPVPKSVTLTDPERISRLPDELSLPVMVKGRFYDARMAYTLGEVRAHFDAISAKWGLPVIVQEFVAGEEFDIVGVGDGDGGLIGSVAMRKMQLTDKGKAWGGITVTDGHLEALVARFVAALKWRGPFEVEVMRKGGSDELFLIEVNPRFPAWVYLAVGAERNLPWAVVQLALGEPVAPFPPAAAGVMFLRHSLDQILTLSDFESLTVRGELHRQEVRP
jgi:carbamoyl-phosphate synthase large subunit